MNVRKDKKFAAAKTARMVLHGRKVNTFFIKKHAYLSLNTKKIAFQTGRKRV